MILIFFSVYAGVVELEWNVRVFVCVNVSDVSGCVLGGECMCMSLFEFAYLRFEEGWEFLFIFWDFFSMSWLFLVQYFDVLIVVHIFGV